MRGKNTIRFFIALGIVLGNYNAFSEELCAYSYKPDSQYQGYSRERTIRWYVVPVKDPDKVLYQRTIENMIKSGFFDKNKPRLVCKYTESGGVCDIPSTGKSMSYEIEVRSGSYIPLGSEGEGHQIYLLPDKHGKLIPMVTQPYPYSVIKPPSRIPCSQDIISTYRLNSLYQYNVGSIPFLLATWTTRGVITRTLPRKADF